MYITCGVLALVSRSVSNREGNQNPGTPRGMEPKAVPAVVGQPRDVLLEASFSSRNHFPSTFDCIRAPRKVPPCSFVGLPVVRGETRVPQSDTVPFKHYQRTRC